MKRIVALSLLLLLLCCSAYAHSGRTDSNGGHWNHSTGEYHYHHGYSAHQHPNGVCPYESKDEATQKPSTRPESGTYTYEQWKAAMAGETVEPTPTPKPTKTPRPTRTPRPTSKAVRTTPTPQPEEADPGYPTEDVVWGVIFFLMKIALAGALIKAFIELVAFLIRTKLWIAVLVVGGTAALGWYLLLSSL